MPIPEALAQTLISGGANIAGGAVGQILAGINQRAMNRYNHPVKQVARLREAGLPMAALTAGNAGNQSSPTPGGDLGLSRAGENIGQYQSTKKQIEEINKIKEDIAQQKMINEKLDAELKWYRAGAGTDPSRTNLTSMLAMEQDMKRIANIGGETANRISGIQAEYTRAKESQSLAEQIERMKGITLTNKLTGEHIEGAEKDNKLKDIEIRYKPRMSEATLRNMLDDHNIKLKDIDLKQLQYTLDRRTLGNKITQSDMETLTKELGYEILGINYQQNKDWDEFRKQSQKLFNELGPTSNVFDFLKALRAFGYTTLGNPQGRTNPLQILGQ